MKLTKEMILIKNIIRRCLKLSISNKFRIKFDKKMKEKNNFKKMNIKEIS